MKRFNWKLCGLVWLGLVASQVHAYETYLKTKFGTLSVDENRLLHFNGKPVMPAVMGNSGLSVGPAFDVDGKVLVISKNIGGTACPELLNVITVDAGKAVSSPTFGTCSEFSKIQVLNKSLVIEMDSNHEGVHKYVYADGVLTDNGKVVADVFSSKPFSVTAVINDPDGYTNLRKAPDGKSAIIGRVDKENSFYTHPQAGDWWQVRVNSSMQGYMHKSRILMVREY
ncbi:MAG: SH3 domain-containing protein [Clostridia bacterium]